MHIVCKRVWVINRSQILSDVIFKDRAFMDAWSRAGCVCSNSISYILAGRLVVSLGFGDKTIIYRGRFAPTKNLSIKQFGSYKGTCISVFTIYISRLVNRHSRLEPLNTGD